jgi:hypothetical protein
MEVCHWMPWNNAAFSTPEDSEEEFIIAYFKPLSWLLLGEETRKYISQDWLRFKSGVLWEEATTWDSWLRNGEACTDVPISTCKLKSSCSHIYSPPSRNYILIFLDASFFSLDTSTPISSEVYINCLSFILILFGLQFFLHFVHKILRINA